MEFRALTAKHIDQLMEIERRCHSYPWSESVMLSCLVGRYFNQGLFLANRLIGFYIAEKAGPDVSLMDICVSPESQGLGFANKLMMHFIESCEQLKTEAQFLEVRMSNDSAISLYNKHGFIETSVRKNYYPAAEGREDALLMTRMLSL